MTTSISSEAFEKKNRKLKNERPCHLPETVPQPQEPHDSHFSEEKKKKKKIFLPQMA